MNENKLTLSDKEKKFLLLVEKNVMRIHLNYIAAGFLLCVAIVGLIVGIQSNALKGFWGTIYFSTLAFFLFIVSRIYQKFYTIINKMKQYIEKLESEKLR